MHPGPADRQPHDPTRIDRPRTRLITVAGAVAATASVWVAGRWMWGRVSGVDQRRRARTEAGRGHTGKDATADNDTRPAAGSPSVPAVTLPDGSMALENAAGLADVRLRPARGLVTVTPHPDRQRAVMIGGYRALAADVIAAWPDPAGLAPYRRQLENEIRNHATAAVLFRWMPIIRRRAERADLNVKLYRTGGRSPEWAVDHLTIADTIFATPETRPPRPPDSERPQ